MNLFFIIKDIEKKLGRKKTLINRPRICDIDILDYKGQIYKLYANNNKLILRRVCFLVLAWLQYPSSANAVCAASLVP